MRKNMCAAVTAIAIALSQAPVAFAQTAGSPGGGRGDAPRIDLQGFSVPNLVLELSLFLPRRPAGANADGPRGLSAQRRDPALSFTADQAALLLPLMRDLRDNPYPTLSGARKLLAAIDGILTPAQKKARDGYRTDRDKAVSAPGAGRQQDLRAMTPQQKRSGDEARLPPLQRRQHAIDAFIKALRGRAAA